jgi:hypothetical protein
VLAVWAAGLVTAVLVGRALDARGVLHLGAAPLTGTARGEGPWTGLLLPGTVAAALVVLGPRLAPRLGRVALPVATASATAAWTLALGMVDGTDTLTAPLTGPHDYLADVDRVGNVPAFLATFAEQIVRGPDVDAWTTHVSGHPPGALLLFWAADRIGLAGPAWAAVLLVVAGSSAAAAVVIAARALAGPAAAAAAAPLVALAPYALWVATSADAAFLAVSAWGLALLAVAVRGHGRAADAAALAGGLLLGGGLYLSYGLVPLGAVAAGVLLTGGAARAGRVGLLGAAGVLVVVLAFAVTGFWWFDGFAATRVRWAQGVGSERPYLYTVGANLVVTGLAAGPAALAGLSRFPRLTGGLRLPVGGAIVAVALADLSGLSRGEVERIWLPFLPWILLAGVALARDDQVARLWLVAQVAVAVAVTVVVRTSW